MMYSMTAFARVSKAAPNRTLVWELKSVNHRYLEHQFRMPDATRSLEPQLREAIRKHLKRGKLDCTLRVDRSSGLADITLNQDRLNQLLTAVKSVEAQAPDLARMTAIDILKWPGLLEEPQLDEDEQNAEVVALFEEGVAELVTARSREGDKLKDTITQRLDQIDTLVVELKPLCRNLAKVQKERLTQKISELTQDLDPARLEQEVALLAQRADVAEELDRLEIHVAEARSNLNGKGPHGRRLDFLTQELNREANTLGAKSILAETSQKAVDLKVLIEQIREQVQNIE